MKLLQSVRGAVIAGFVLAMAIALLIAPTGFHELGLARWLHILSGVMWVGLLWYFNLVQIPALAAAAADSGGPGAAGITRYVAPRAFDWFRWAALATWLTGVWYLGRSGNLAGSFALGLHGGTFNRYQLVIGLGAWLGTIMLFNVWALIWPSQRRLLGLVPASDEEKARGRRVALNASRVNFVLSIPLLMCMGAASHGLPF